MKSYAVIGLGLFGSQVAMDLFEQGKDVMAIDMNPELVEEYANRVSRAVVADAKKRDVLKQLGVDQCDCAIVAMTSDLATSVLVTMNLKALGIGEIICKAQNETDMEVLETLGATQVIIPEKIAATRLCRKMCHPNVLEYIEVSEEFGIVEIQVPKHWLGHNIIELNVRAKYGINIIAIKQKGKMIFSFDAKYNLQEEDILILLGDSKALKKIQNLD